MEQKYEYKGDGYPVELPSNYPDDITVVLYIPDEVDDFEDETDLTPEEIEAALDVPPPFSPFKIISYFKLRDNKGRVVTGFTPPLELHLKYTYSAWYESQDLEFWQEKGRPRVFYLEKQEESWAEEWLEFPDRTINAKKPADKKSFGYLYISIPKLPDPRIGGC